MPVSLFRPLRYLAVTKVLPGGGISQKKKKKKMALDNVDIYSIRVF
jgi:hypothetical protein